MEIPMGPYQVFRSVGPEGAMSEGTLRLVYLGTVLLGKERLFAAGTTGVGHKYEQSRERQNA